MTYYPDIRSESEKVTWADIFFRKGVGLWGDGRVQGGVRNTKNQMRLPGRMLRDSCEDAMNWGMVGAMENHDSVPRLTLFLGQSPADGIHYEFTDGFLIGRHADCQVRLDDHVVSRRHAQIRWENDQWWIIDMNSANGVYVDGRRVEKAPLAPGGHFRLGYAGPEFSYLIEQPLSDAEQGLPQADRAPEKEPAADSPAALDHYKAHYFGPGDGGQAGEHTMMVRRAFAEVQKKQRRTYTALIGVVLVLLIITGAVALVKHRQVVQQRKLAAEIFYALKALEIDLLKLQAEAEQRRSLETKIQIDTARTRKTKLQESYDRYVQTLDVYSSGLSEKEKIILRMARRFGECEINMPEGFVKEVMAYIEKWQSTQRFVNVMQRAKRQGLVSKVVQALAERELPAQFLYLALQESNLNAKAVGPPTRFGIAKGMWQFIPQTAVKYGLRTGPLKDEAVMDSLDERHDAAKSTAAAARYLRDIYTTDAQASGLLVMASYNWGEHRVIDLIQTIPANPRDRNFWQLITTYRDKIPDETYDYVFRIFSAAVIGENPRLFGFDMDNPLSLMN